MTRHVLIRAEDAQPQVVGEAALPTEAELHDALTQYPALLPSSDLGLGEAVVVGRESGLAAGYADLVLVDDRGRLCLVEVKNEGNPDTRRVVAQLLDYAASLWGVSLDEFDQRVLQPFLAAAGETPPFPSISEYIAESLTERTIEPDAVAEQLAQALAAGDFTLVVAAPQIPLSVQRVLEYLNARGQRFFGLEVSYFRGPVECFVPRLVVKPLVSDPAGDPLNPPPLDEETFLQQIPERIREPVGRFLATVAEAGADVVWRTYGPSITVAREKQRQVAWLESKRLGITLKATADFPQDPFDRARGVLAEASIGSDTKDGWYRRVSFSDATDASLGKALEVVRQLVEDVTPAVDFEPLPAPLDVAVVRNDHNLWARHAPDLARFHGRHLRGRVVDAKSGQEAAVHLVPLAGGQPGWRPRFTPHGAKDTLWSPAKNGASFQLVVERASA
ncbi:MAG TPA: hypothetical protein VGV67_05150 [Solirubrobacteraceae bacterium]|nr:hypothetical protein [Solirubrobacteraceae bacterium]